MNIPPNKDLAIKYALQNDWKNASEINFLLFEQNPQDIETLNRLAYSLLKLGKLDESKQYYEKVLEIDSTNPIAVKNLKKISQMNGHSMAPSSESNHVVLDTFIEEAGKTKTVELKNIADFKTISFLQPGDQVLLTVKRSKIFVQTMKKTYIGMLPDSVGLRLVKLMNGGNEYQACIKSINDKVISVFIKETKCSKKFQDQPSFINYELGK